MLIFNPQEIGNKLLATRKRAGLTQAEVAEAAGLSDRTYADIERGMANMRLETLLQICEALHITPNELLTDDPPQTAQVQRTLADRFSACTDAQKQTALQLLEVYLNSLQ